MFLTILSVIILIILLITLLDIGSNLKTTNKNIEFISDIYEKLETNEKNKVDYLIQWHKKNNYPLFIERSIKYYIHSNSFNNSRFTVVVPLSYFFVDSKLWDGWCAILEVPDEIREKCLEYIALGRGDIDFIWGLDLEAISGDDGTYSFREKIYLEDCTNYIIYAYVYKNNEILERYHYYRKSIEDKNNKFSFMYMRTNLNIDKKRIDSYHCALRKPLEISYNSLLGIRDNKLTKDIKYKIHLVSIKKNESYTFYYRHSF